MFRLLNTIKQKLSRTRGAVLPLSSPVPDNVASAVPYQMVEEEVAIDRSRWCADPELLARLLRENPALACIRSGGGMYLFCVQFSMLKPELHDKLQPAFTLISVGSMAVGFSLSALSISFTKADSFFGIENVLPPF